MLNIIKKLFIDSFYFIFRPIWSLEKLIHRNNNLWIFGAWFGKKYSDNSKWLYEYVIKNHPEIKAVWITKDKNILKNLRNDNKNVYLSSSLKGISSCLKAGYAFLTNGVEDVNMYFLNGCKQIWLWHGMPLKKILRSTDSWKKLTENQIKKSKIINPYNYLNPDYTITSSDFFTPFLQEAFNLPENKILKTGLPRVDGLFSNINDDFCDSIRQQYPNVKLFFYMPTYRTPEKLKNTSYNPFDKKFGFDIDIFTKTLEEKNIVIIYKPHYVDQNMNLSIKCERLILLNDSMYKDLYILLKNIDVLMTDYSSVFFDFLPSKKPIMLLPFDYNEYIQYSRSHYFNMFEEMNAFVCKDWSEVYNNLNSVLSCVGLDNIDQNNKKFIDYNDGNACKKIVNKIKEL